MALNSIRIQTALKKALETVERAAHSEIELYVQEYEHTIESMMADIQREKSVSARLKESLDASDAEKQALELKLNEELAHRAAAQAQLAKLGEIAKKDEQRQQLFEELKKQLGAAQAELTEMAGKLEESEKLRREYEGYNQVLHQSAASLHEYATKITAELEETNQKLKVKHTELSERESQLREACLENIRLKQIYPVKDLIRIKELELDRVTRIIDGLPTEMKEHAEVVEVFNALHEKKKGYERKLKVAEERLQKAVSDVIPSSGFALTLLEEPATSKDLSE